MRKTVLILLIQETGPRTVFMGIKKKGFGTGKYCAYGGKLEPGETETLAAIRELQEESGITVNPFQLRNAGFIEFYFPAKPEWDLSTQVFIVHDWEGIPRESEEIIPVNFPVADIPYPKMWPDSILWLPAVLDGKKVTAKFIYNSDNQNLADYDIQFEET